MIALATRRNQVSAVGETESNVSLPIAEPTCTDAIPASTSQIARVRSRLGFWVSTCVRPEG